VVIDRTHRNWAIATAAACGVATVLYIATSRTVLLRPYGGTVAGLTLGIVAFALMVFSALLGLRKRFLGLRIGRLHQWMRGHLWMGLLTVPMVLLHAGFQNGGPLTAVLMVLTLVVGISGIVGAVLQHILPSMLTREVPLETVFEQIPHIREQMHEEGQTLVAAALAPPKATKAVAAEGGVATATVAPPAPSLQALEHFWEAQLAPFLLDPSGSSMLASEAGSESAFRRLHTMLPTQVHPTLDSLASLAEEARQLERQQTIHYWLHGWLFLHVPLSYALLALATVHAWRAWRY
jgi:hypothetical protein